MVEVTRVKFKHFSRPEDIARHNAPAGTELVTVCELFVSDGGIWIGKSRNPDRKLAKAEAEADARRRMARNDWGG